MTAIVALLAVVVAAPICPVPIGQPVMIVADELPEEMLGVDRLTDPGWPAPSGTSVGDLRHGSGLLLRSNDARFADFDLAPDAVHSRSSDCWFQWDSGYESGAVTSISNPRIAARGYRQGYIPPRPDATPDIPGFRFVAANDVHRDGFTWIGIWNAKGSAERSRIIAFNDDQHVILATLPIRLGAIAQLPDLHSQTYYMTLMGEGKVGHPVPWIRLIWPGGAPIGEKPR